ARAHVKAVVFSVEQKRERERESKRVFFIIFSFFEMSILTWDTL
ncbi:hypothetical protein HMPREF1432_01211, partial [Helicobacter pylori GAMchJs114i]